MEERWVGEYPATKKCDAVASMINKIITQVAIRCYKVCGVRHYFDIGVIRYGANIGSAFTGALQGRGLVSIVDIANNPSRVEKRAIKTADGAGGIITQDVDFAVWIDPVAEGATPMCGALKYAHNIVKEWTQDHSAAFPPIVINIAGGQPTDGDPSPIAQNIMQLSTDDGNVLLYNCHISGQSSARVIFPDNDSELPGEYSKMLFNMSNILPGKIINEAQKMKYQVGAGSRGFAFNASLVELIQFLDI